MPPNGPRARQLRTTAHDPHDIQHVPLSDLIGLCLAEYERFQRSGTQDTCYAYEIFRRALVSRDNDAWAFLYQQYHRLVERWVRRVSAFEHSGESSEYFVSAAFERFWQALTPERFTTFPTVAALLHYLQCCAGSVVIDSARRRQHDEELPADGDSNQADDRPGPDQAALDNVARREFWQVVASRLRNETEQVLIVLSFVYDMKPREIFEARHELFSSVPEIYALKRNLLERLGRDAEIRKLLG